MMPPKSAVERMRLYRLRLSETKKEEAKEKNRMSQQLYRAKWTNKRKIIESTKGAVRKDLSRQMKKERKMVVKIIHTPTKVFGSRQSYGRALARVNKSLPTSPKKNQLWLPL